MSGLMLTFPVHQAADILFCKANLVPVGKDQLPHIEVTRLIARRFDERYGRAVPETPVFPQADALLRPSPAMLGLDGVVITEEGFGNPDADLVMNCWKAERLGIKTALLTDEYAGQDGASQSLADSCPEGNACVTAGNANEVIVLPPMDKVIGFPETAHVIAGGWQGSLADDGTITVELQAITGATSELGYTKLGAYTL